MHCPAVGNLGQEGAAVQGGEGSGQGDQGVRNDREPELYNTRCHLGRVYRGQPYSYAILFKLHAPNQEKKVAEKRAKADAKAGKAKAKAKASPKNTAAGGGVHRVGCFCGLLGSFAVYYWARVGL